MAEGGVTIHSTGLPGLDRVIQEVRPGDNIVWQVDTIADYTIFAEPYCQRALADDRRLIYFRFAQHAPLLADDSGAEICHLRPEVGFETFTAEIHRVIGNAGLGAYYLFDCLSDLAADWYSDMMLGNFFMVTCPYLYELETITYFALLRDHHSFEAVAAIRDTTQVLLDVFRHEGKLYVHPLKVDRRHSPTMYLPHIWEEGEFRPLTESSVLADVMVPVTERRVDALSRTTDVWERKAVPRSLVLAATPGGLPGPESNRIAQRLLRMMVTRDERVMDLASRYLTLPELLAIRKRLIGSGLIGGKSVGMLLARAILRSADPRWHELLEPHDSFYIGTDVFYTYLVRNGCWHIRRNQRDPARFLEGAEEARQRIFSGTFPPPILKQFIAMLEYFGQAPIIVRSSSLLEDGFGNAFTGKYESVFCPNQGTPEQRLEAFLSAVRTVYASTMSEEALLYRAHRGLLDGDEQMAILVQRVSGAVRGHLFYPHIAGVGLSYNPYAWSEYIDPQAGVLRLVFGLGTRAVERSDDDYTRVVALNAPDRRPERDIEEAMEFGQHRVDVLDLRENRFASLRVNDVIAACPDQRMDLFASPRRARGEDRGRGAPAWVVTFESLLRHTPFVGEMRDMLRALREAYDYPVDIEFTTNFLPDGRHRINLVQCRPFQVREGGNLVAFPMNLGSEDVFFEARGTIIGQSSFTPIDRVIYVVPERYAELPVSDRYAIARLIGRLTHAAWAGTASPTILLLGPGRWGTSTPSFGVPVTFAEINTVSVLCEIVAMGKNVVPSVSLGTHFFNDLVEANMLYLALYPGREGNSLNEEFFSATGNSLAQVLPDEVGWSDVVRVVDFPAAADGRKLLLNANCFEQRALCYLAP